MNNTTATSAKSPAIELAHLRKTFGTFVAVEDLTLTVERGEIFGLLGPNGSGKTTTVNMVSGLSQATSGTVHILGYDIQKDIRQIRQCVGAVPQETALYEDLTAWQNMDFHCDLYGVPVKEKNTRIQHLLDLVQLSDRKTSRVGTYSGGMKRRLAFARALLHEPELIYLDEPTLGVDVQSRNALWEYMRQQRDHGKTVLITTNYLEEANELCDRMAILDHGKLVALDTPSKLKQQYGGMLIDFETQQKLSAETVAKLRALPTVSKVTEINEHEITINATGEQVLTGKVIELVSVETTIKAITQREPNLNEVFLNLTGKALRD
ncbi:MAG: ABC transporter ATP-binding protein [Anaerolineae bacterium]|nr:ABC transporter ATP-binding protein [Anaerolineae bacterium]